MEKNKQSREVSRTAAAVAATVIVAALVCVLAANAALPAPQSSAPPVRIVKYHGTVVTANGSVIILRNPYNPHDEMTFSYSPPVRDLMIKVLAAGGFQYGDKLTVIYANGTTVALKLQGKPSKPKKTDHNPNKPQSAPSSSSS